jgi:tRNA threonylcarbamoyladenosine biosynthesis protein TsaE
MQSIILVEEAATIALGHEIAKYVVAATLIYLKGDLGTGKTTLVRGILRGLGYQGKVKSPTYTLVEEYHFPLGAFYHFDLYRLSHPEELDYIGFSEYLDSDAVLLIEWPECGSGFLPPADIEFSFKSREDGREVQIDTTSEKGQALWQHLKGFKFL